MSEKLEKTEMQRNRGKEQNGKDQRSFQEYQITREFSCKDGHHKEQKWYGPKEAEYIKNRW